MKRLKRQAMESEEIFAIYIYSTKDFYPEYILKLLQIITKYTTP